MSCAEYRQNLGRESFRPVIARRHQLRRRCRLPHGARTKLTGSEPINEIVNANTRTGGRAVLRHVRDVQNAAPAASRTARMYIPYQGRACATNAPATLRYDLPFVSDGLASREQACQWGVTIDRS
jgi:hypothetical protein